LNDYISYLPEHFPTLNNKAPLSKEAAKRLNLIDGIPVVSGPLDVIATAIGVGAINVTDGCSINRNYLF